jgi:hypothetical protein
MNDEAKPMRFPGGLPQLAAILRALPHFQPDPAWRGRTRERLLRAYEELYCRLDAARRWAVYVTYDDDPLEFADSVRERGAEWRPVAIKPERLEPAVRNLQPNLVVIDPRVPRAKTLVGVVRAASMAETDLGYRASA